MIDEKDLAIHPLVPESIQHNNLTLSQLRNLSASLFGVAAGILGLESYPGFIFYLVGTLLVSALVYLFPAKREPKRYFQGGLWELIEKDVLNGLMSFVLTWTLFFGLVSA
ncbi:hypothetical protein L228DRAFT_215946 [Xylona heveae TC161]|uniref:ER membrane protein complex subunit 6 n=1 Tax=Xylona heveae (strain CBS 132557 / TC161) TaxID=1328760 RepID=A0A165J8U9_XYLHT|nr:hypothetical protein L228DRAFT_215946 [Xylona heveae TC161]KZF25907.1 hypothetical protein L228DRAFT_215946 [Xylona heveae TC161]